jgi:hypothetical protein
VIADFDCRFLIEGVEHRAVLYVDAVADAYGVDVAAYYGVEPYGAVVAHDHVADYGGVFGQETILSDLRRKSAYRYY